MDPCSQHWPSVLHPKYLLLQSPPASSLYLVHKQWCQSLHLQPLPPIFSYCSSSTSICMYLHTYSHISWTSGCVVQCPRDKKWRKKRWNNFRNKIHSWLAAPRLTSTVQGQPALPQRWPALDHISPDSSQQSMGQIPGRIRSVPWQAGRSTHRASAA